MSGGTRKRPPLSPKEAWLSDGRQVLHFRPSRWDRWSQQLEVTVGELLQDQPVPLLKRRLELSREETIKLWAEKRKAVWAPCSPQWCGDFQGRCHSLAATQATRIDGSARIGSGSSGGLLIHTSSG